MMRLLPFQQTHAQIGALYHLSQCGAVTLREPCNCGTQIRHNNGGNYHSIISFRMDGGKIWRAETHTGDYAPDEDWTEVPFSSAIDEITGWASKGWSVDDTG